MALFTKEILILSRHLHFPVRSGSPKVKLQILLGGQAVREFDIELAGGDPVDWWAFYDVSAFEGQTVTLASVGSDLPEEQTAWLAGAIRQSDGIIGGEDLYQETYRPQFHFTVRRGWNNDPNGMVFYQGEWHLYYQHNPFGVGWGNMHWGHAVSPDLAHWEELPEALYQRSLEDMAYSGGGVIDQEDTAGFKEGDEAPLVVFFTSTGRSECLAFSLDRGRTFKEYAGNPILTHHGRDPKVIRYAPGNKWVLIVYEEQAEQTPVFGGDGSTEPMGYAIYDSVDLKHWRRQSFLPGWYECPELFELPVTDQPGVTKWVVHGNAFKQFIDMETWTRVGPMSSPAWKRYSSAFMVGEFDGQTFTPTQGVSSGHYGPMFYAAQVFSDAPGGRRVMMGWLFYATYPGMPFSQGMTVPLELSLRQTGAGYRLCFYPAVELEKLANGQLTGQGLDLAGANALLAKAEGELFDVRLELQADGSGPVKFDVGGHPVAWNPGRGEVSFAGRTASLEPGKDRLALRVLVDRSVMEVFADEGYAAFASAAIFPDGKREMRLEGGVASAGVVICALKSIWG